jgi:hypothetical protein
MEGLCAAPDPSAADHRMLAPFFLRQVEAGIGCLPFMMPATKENVEALHVAVCFFSFHNTFGVVLRAPSLMILFSCHLLRLFSLLLQTLRMP